MKILNRAVLILGFLALIAVTPAFAGDVYVAQSGAGASNGSSCSNAVAWNYFSVAGNWQPGTTFHICGTYNGGPGGTGINVLGSGSAGNPITIKFESGAVLQAPYWGTNPFNDQGEAALVCAGKSYIVVDGGTNGIIQNTANGTGLTYQQGSTGIDVHNCPYFTITGALTVRHIYVHHTEDMGGVGDTIAVAISDSDHFSVTGATITDAHFALGIGFNVPGSITSGTIANNVIDHGCHILQIGDGNGGASASGIVVRNNVIGPHNQEWTDDGSGCHQNVIFLQAANSGSTISNFQIYDNTIQSDMCSNVNVTNNCTGFVTYGENVSGTNFYNNVVQNVGASGGWEALVILRDELASQTNNAFYNNTFDANNVGSPACDCALFKSDAPNGQTQTGFSVRNNIFLNLPNTVFLAENSSISTIYSGGIDNNAYYNTGRIGSGGGNYTSFSQWQAAGFDRNGIVGNPNLSGNYAPQSGSSVGNLGANLMGLGIVPLDKDKNGAARPVSGSWSAGAIQFGGGALPAPPTALSASVQ